jgi:hypothetical protein
MQYRNDLRAHYEQVLRGPVLMQRSSRAPFVVAALIGALPLLVLATAAPGGGDWRWLEYPRHITLIAAVLGLVVCSAKTRATAIVVLAGTVAITLAWELIGEYRGLAKFGRTDLFGKELGLLVDVSVVRAAPWLAGVSYTLIAYLSIARSRDLQANLRRAAVWLIGVGLVALAITLNNESWLTLENLKGDGVYRSSTRWPDTKELSLVADLFAVAAGIGALLYRRRSTRLPKATLRE